MPKRKERVIQMQCTWMVRGLGLLIFWCPVVVFFNQNTIAQTSGLWFILVQGCFFFFLLLLFFVFVFFCFFGKGGGGGGGCSRIAQTHDLFFKTGACFFFNRIAKSPGLWVFVVQVFFFFSAVFAVS